MISKIPPHVRWVGLVLGLLGMSVAIQGTALFLSSREPLGLVPDYEDKAAHWNDHQEQLARNEALGWEVDLSVAAVPGGAEFVLDVDDATGDPLADAAVSAVVFHNANADARLPLDLTARGPGVYGVAAPLKRAGIYEIQLEIRRGDDLFTAVLRETVTVGG